jgi:hypothetical protein
MELLFHAARIIWMFSVLLLRSRRRTWHRCGLNDLRELGEDTGDVDALGTFLRAAAAGNTALGLLLLGKTADSTETHGAGVNGIGVVHMKQLRDLQPLGTSVAVVALGTGYVHLVFKQVKGLL